MGAKGLDWRVCFESRVLNCARTIVAALWDFEMLHSGLPAEPDGLENEGDHGLERGPAIEWGHDESIHGRPRITVSAALFKEWLSSASPGAKKHASAMFLLLCFLFWSLAWYTRFPLPCYKSVLRKSTLSLLGPLRPFKIML